MSPEDQQPFFDEVDATCDVIGCKVLSGAGKAMMFTDLERYPFELIAAALAAHRADKDRGQWAPSTANIEYQIDRRRKNAWLSADEAFARLTFEESEPCLLNQVTAQALAVAAPHMNQARPDRNAARMAFRACYERLVEQEKLNRQPPQYFVSPGGSIEAQDAVKAEGVRMGLLPQSWTPQVQALEYDAAGHAKVLGHIANMRALLAPKEAP